MSPIAANANQSGPGTWLAWKQALRVPSFSATISPLLVGSAYALVADRINFVLVILMFLAAIACHAGANLANDYFDHRRGVDTPENPGSSRVIQLGLLSTEQVKLGMVVAFAVAIALGLAIVAMTGWAILALALACLAVAVLYTGGPFPLGYVALGEVAVFLAMGLALPVGAFLVLTGTITSTSVLIALPNACLITALIHVNNLRDVTRDREAGKRTVAMLIGRVASIRLYAGLIAAAYLLLATVVVREPILWPILAALVTLSSALRLLQALASAHVEPEFSRILRGTNRLLFEFGVLVAAGLVFVALTHI